VRILVVEDEQKLANVIGESIGAEGHSVRVSYTGEEAFYLAVTEEFDLIVLDVMLPGRDGFEILATLRRRGLKTPVLLLTAKDAIEDRVRGFDIGADDYLVKPFAFPELLARVRSLLKRGKPEPPRRYSVGDLEMDVGARSVVRAGENIKLTAREFDLLEFLFANQGQVVSRKMLARHVWNETYRSGSMDNVIDAQVVRLRRKIDGRFSTKLLHTAWGVGFVLREEPGS
jgi:DNA-binding response OmpR family regulator